jgi:alanine racemase
VSVDRAVARVNLAAIERNCRRLGAELREGVQLCAVVKAEGYGHGLLESARAALAGGATWLAVASVAEARELVDVCLTEEGLDRSRETRAFGAGRFGDASGASVPLIGPRFGQPAFGRLRHPPGARLLVLGPLRALEVEEAVFLDIEVVAWREDLIGLVGELAKDMGKTARVHVKLDTGMGRFGLRDPERASRVVAAAAEDPHVELAGVMTHFATADERGDAFFGEQLQRFSDWAQAVKREHPEVIVHAANSAAVLREPAAHFDMVRCGIAIYGMDPFGEDPRARGLEPALELSTYVAAVKHCRAGESTGYGRRFVAAADTHLGLLPIGYGDGWRRGLSGAAEVLIAGRRHPLVGAVSMDSVAVDLGGDPLALALLDQPAILIGCQGEERITAEEIARSLETINYEITCGLTARVARVHHSDDGVAQLAGEE